MNEGMDRRDFLKYSLATGIALAAGNHLTGSSNAMASPKITEVDKLSIWILADNYYDALRPDNKVTNRYRVVPGKSIHAEHGLSYYIETLVDGKTSGCMFDYGLDPIGVMNNIDLLGLDLGKANAFGLSHGHFDHWMGAVEILKRAQSKIQKGTPFYLGEEGFAHRYSVRPGGTDAMDLGQLKKEDIERFGVKVVEVSKPAEIIPGAYFTGNIERHTAYEKIPPTLLIKRGEKPEPDDFRGEQAIFFKVKGKGLVVLSGCAHRGIVNTVVQSQKVSGTDQLHAVLGGFHLINAKPEIIQNTVADIKSMKPEYVAPTHCTGFEAISAFCKEMPEQFTLNTAGTKYTFSA
ncbi:MAG: twin-arginine translocation signal domain-containing protein [Desulfobacteraceae bacterium]|nr:MAG: twin-arginine translocation signal domain-containing protein [Desulfobacteraceae bacterium]